MPSDIIIIDEPYIWIASIKDSTTIIELSKITSEQHFLFSKEPIRLMDYFHSINEEEVRKIDQASKVSPFTRFGNMDLLKISLNWSKNKELEDITLKNLNKLFETFPLLNIRSSTC